MSEYYVTTDWETSRADAWLVLSAVMDYVRAPHGTVGRHPGDGGWWLRVSLTETEYAVVDWMPGIAGMLRA